MALAARSATREFSRWIWAIRSLDSRRQSPVAQSAWAATGHRSDILRGIVERAGLRVLRGGVAAGQRSERGPERSGGIGIRPATPLSPLPPRALTDPVRCFQNAFEGSSDRPHSNAPAAAPA